MKKDGGRYFHDTTTGTRRAGGAGTGDDAELGSAVVTVAPEFGDLVGESGIGGFSVGGLPCGHVSLGRAVHGARSTFVGVIVFAFGDLDAKGTPEEPELVSVAEAEHAKSGIVARGLSVAIVPRGLLVVCLKCVGMFVRAAFRG